jgi:hypothetical protein
MNVLTLLAIGPFQILIILIIPLLIILPTWFLYKKAGEPGWASIVPFYSTLVWLKIIGKPWYWLLLFLIPYVNLIFLVWATNLTSKSYGKEEGFTFGLLFLPSFHLCLLGRS